MNCTRCNGLMVSDVYAATQWAEQDDTYYYRCVSCGNCEDALIVLHRHSPPPQRTGYGMQYKAKLKVQP